MDSTTRVRDRTRSHSGAQSLRTGQAGPGRAARIVARPAGVRDSTRLGSEHDRNRSATAAARAASLPARATPRFRRAPFVLLVLSLLGGGLICLLAINTTLSATGFEITRLQGTVNARSLQIQNLQQQIATDESPAKIGQEAYSLGMRQQGQLEFLDLRTHRVYGQQPTANDGASASGSSR